jgi:hypothetical protein
VVTMAWAIKLLETAAGEVTEFDGQYVKAYDPTYHPPGEEYDGGILEVTPHVEEALTFASSTAAFAKWRQAHGLRSDGMPNRPVTAWTVEVELIEAAKPVAGECAGEARKGEVA